MADFNFDINEVKEKVMSTIGNVADMTKDFAEKTADKAKSIARIAKLSMEINAEKDVIKKAYIEIGKLYYETHKDDPDGFFAQLCEEITQSMENISAKQAEIDSLKSDITDDDSIEVEFEAVVSEAEEEATECPLDTAEEPAQEQEEEKPEEDGDEAE
ncbi:MAG TPA: hypothetical protein GXZ52_00410 [Clostridiales bacterium]|nr:hypothetical protein [Clostridiales bacterium]